MSGIKADFRDLDWITVGMYFFLIFLGWCNIYSAIYVPEAPPEILDLTNNSGKQILWVGIAFFLAYLIFNSNVTALFTVTYLIYAFSLVVLAGVLVAGVRVHGAKAWYQFGPVRIMPAEFVKVTIALAVAKFFDENRVSFNLKDPSTLRLLVILVIPTIIILAQNETGTLLVYSSLILVFYREGLKPIFPFVGILLAILLILSLKVDNTVLLISYGGIATLLSLAAYVLIAKRWRFIILVWTIAGCSTLITLGSNYFVFNILQGHQRSRILDTFGVVPDPKGVGWQAENSKTAISSGGFWGKGYLKGELTQGDFIPEQHTDFIFTTVGEEHGFVGTAFVVVCYMIFLTRLLYLAERQKSTFSRVYGYCVTSFLFFHFAVNIGMTIGLMPVIGIPLPFMSYGGSSIWAFTIFLAIFLKLDMHRNQFMSR